jgi:hypothetical protein
VRRSARATCGAVTAGARGVGIVVVADVDLVVQTRHRVIRPATKSVLVEAATRSS